MSNLLAIATVTAALQQRLIQAITGSGVLNPFVTTDRPDRREQDKRKGVNIFLYQIQENPQRNNLNLPARRADGSYTQKPRIVLDLRYLVTFHGDEKLLETQRMLAAVVSNLNVSPTLSPAEIKDNVITPAASVPDSDPRHFLGQSDLPAQPELVRFSLVALSLEDQSRLWSTYAQTPASLSVVYQASVVIVEPSAVVVKPALPVAQPNVYVLPFHQPEILKVYPDIGEGMPVVNGSILVLEGRNLKGEVTRVIAGGIESTPAPADLGEASVRLPLPGGIRVGLQGVQVIHRLLMGNPAVEHRGFESNVFPLVVSPKITTVAKSAAVNNGGLFTLTFTLGVQPLLRQDQRATLLLNGTSTPNSYAFSLPPLPADTASLAVPVSRVAAGEYYLRLQVDGAESPLIDLNPLSANFGQLTGPKATIP
jgi:hypothetical protein